MKNHNRQTSQQLKIFKHTTMEVAPYRFEMVAKNFRKKGSPYEPGINSSTNITKHFQLQRRTQTKGSPVRSESKTKTGRKRSLQKFISNHRVSERASINNHNTTYTTLSTRSKLMKITSILCGAIAGTSKDMMSQVYHRYDQYIALSKEWKQLGIFDEADQFILLLVENYLRTIETLLGQTCSKMNLQLQGYQAVIDALHDENKKMREQIKQFQQIEKMILPVRQKLMEEYEKSQWSTFILNSLALQSFDLQNFIKEIPLYQKWADPSAHERLKLRKQLEGQFIEKQSTSNVLGQMKSKSEWFRFDSLDRDNPDYFQI